MTEQKADLTFKHNLTQGRHGWLRLTPAYSIKMVYQIISQHPEVNTVLDPFSGTGTTGLVCAERGIDCQLFDINPFLVWLAQAKTANYDDESLKDTLASAEVIIRQVTQHTNGRELWIPRIHDISRWWADDKLNILATLFHEIQTLFPDATPPKNLLLVAFCRVVIAWSNASFNHQSMLFQPDTGQRQLGLFENERTQLLDQFMDHVAEIIVSARKPVSGRVSAIQADARTIPSTDKCYDCVITSPPYPNRMSYIRELRPYMYWLGYLNEAREAGELDWQAIGGTWGIATSRLNDWQPNGEPVPHTGFAEIISQIAETSPLLSRYVHRYFIDISTHLESLHAVLKPGAPIYYVVGNSKFYDTLVPVEEIYASSFRHAGFTNVTIEKIRKRNSKKELYEFVVSARKP